MARFARTVHIEAPASDIWAVMMDVEDWPTWASQFKRLEALDRLAPALAAPQPNRPPSVTRAEAESQQETAIR